MKVSRAILVENATALIKFVLDGGKNFDNTRFAECLKKSFPEVEINELKQTVRLGRICAVAERERVAKVVKQQKPKTWSGLGVVESSPEQKETIRRNVEEWQRKHPSQAGSEVLDTTKEAHTEELQIKETQKELPLPPITMMSITFKPLPSPKAIKRATVAANGGVGNDIRTGKTARKRSRKAA